MTRRPTPLDALIDRYRSGAKELREAGAPDSAGYYNGLTEGLRIARRVLWATDPEESVTARLNTYRDARGDVAAAVRAAADLGWGTSRIARESGLSRWGVMKMLDRTGGATEADSA